ncbi:hypothetical protein QR680_010894 [Steinernema hermaphroditum]|uniref:F-box domain-containing protein n=1 Tax=Steinernema hermaphroditum TaxID=289476 RepID=A0AA39MBF0_9BILA|nr:hypothetical protein QR680_010894 [Steinernema hermaphroditum]
MESLSPELVAAILDAVNFKSLKSLSLLCSSWQDSVDRALPQRFDATVEIAFLKGSYLVDYSMKKDLLTCEANSIFYSDRSIRPWTYSDSDSGNIETMYLSVKTMDHQLDIGLQGGIRQSRPSFLRKMHKVFRLMTACRIVTIDIDELEDYPGDLLDLLPEGTLPGKLVLNTVKCNSIPPFDIPIRLRRAPFDTLNAETLRHASTLRDKDALDWLVDMWSRQQRMWKEPISIRFEYPAFPSHYYYKRRNLSHYLEVKYEEDLGFPVAKIRTTVDRPYSPVYSFFMTLTLVIAAEIALILQYYAKH